jgi:2-phosphoglycerate kinase
MAGTEDAEKGAGARRAAKGSGGRALIVEESGLARPFMRGIMVHSLMARGVSFDDAYQIADSVRDQLRGRGEVPREDLSKIVRDILGEDYEHQPPIPAPITLSVVSNRRSTPFSKGTLAQSLLAASVEPDAAFEVAREIELELLREGRHEVQQADVRTQAYKALLRRFGRRTAQRYLVWREFQEPEKPVIILLGGTTGAGKTSLALEVARRLGIGRVLSADAIRQVMRIMLSPELMPALHVSSFDADHTVTRLDDGDSDDDETVIQGFMAQAEAVSVGVRAIMDRAIEENSSLVLDGVSLVPGLLDLASYAEHAHVFFLLVARLDEEGFRGHFAARAERERRRDAQRYMERLDEILSIQEYLLEQAERRDVPIVDNVTLEGSVLLVIRHVVESLRKVMVSEIAEPS